MKRVPLRSKRGCLKCKSRRVKCDEQRPLCGHCARLGFACRWTTPDQRPDAVNQTLVSLLTDLQNRATPCDDDTRSRRGSGASESQSSRQPSFDNPAVLRTSAVPDGGNKTRKVVLQYVSEQGTSILKYPTKLFPSHYSVNTFREGFVLAVHSPLHMFALTCLGAGHLARLDASWDEVALRYYNLVMSNLRKALMRDVMVPPAEWMCAVSAILSFYELIVLHSPESRLAHLVGFHRLVEIRIVHNQRWSPMKILIEQYIHSLSNGCIFHYDILVGEKGISYMDKLIALVNEKPRAMGREIVGIPEELTAATYRLAVLNHKDISQSPWDVELMATATRLRAWAPAPHALAASGSTLLFVGKLYQLACMCLLRNIVDREADATDGTVAAYLSEASRLVQTSEFRYKPFNTMVWPLTILAIFAADQSQQLAFQQPLLCLAEISKVEGYRSILHFLSVVEKEQLGPRVLLRPDLLELVHM